MKKNRCMLAVKVVIAMMLLACILIFWTHTAEEEAHYTPDYPMEDISALLEKESLTEEEYAFLYRQTGLGPIAVDALRSEKRCEELFVVQERFFAEAEVVCEGDFLLYNEVLAEPWEASRKGRTSRWGKQVIPVLEDGDILITFNSHFLGWRNGHAAIVIDAERGLTLEALMLGKDSAVLSVNGWSDCPSFAVLRVAEMSKEQRAEVAAYAKNTMTEIPYRLTAGIWDGLGAREIRNAVEVGAGNISGGEGEERAEYVELAGTQCAHLVWYAYKQFGYDLDSDGGFVVTPENLYDSPLLEVVQIYGMKPE